MFRLYPFHNLPQNFPLTPLWFSGKIYSVCSFSYILIFFFSSYFSHFFYSFFLLFSSNVHDTFLPFPRCFLERSHGLSFTIFPSGLPLFPSWYISPGHLLYFLIFLPSPKVIFMIRMVFTRNLSRNLQAPIILRHTKIFGSH